MSRKMNPDAARWIAALNHPLRRHILRILGETEIASATEIARQKELRLGNVAYHVKVLADLEVLELVHQRKVRGASEKFYRSTAANGDGSWVAVVLERTRQSDPD
ncbi:MAG TPA: helix-turn-helix domain-containing protein [Solirubrobacterales bacterium]|nr:helix-turn-helix domain-containing protein [Solirubrobacterales bacterium]